MDNTRYSWTPTSEEMANVFLVLEFNHLEMARFVKIMALATKTEEQITFVKDVLEKKLKIEYFCNLKRRISETDYNYFVSKLLVQHHERNSIIIEKHKRNDYFYILVRGEINIVDEVIRPGRPPRMTTQSIEYEVINTLKSGDTFGEVSLLNPKLLTTARVVAKTDVFLLVANQETFHRTINDSEFMKYEGKLNFFFTHPLFQGIEEPRIRDIIPEVRAIKYTLNQHIYSKGDLHEEMYFIAEGEVLLQRDNENSSKPVSLVSLVTGECFGIERPDLEVQGTLRSQTAISRSTDLTVYRVLFKRLALLQEGYQIFLTNTFRNLRKKMIVHEQLEKNYVTMQSITKKGFVIKASGKKKKKAPVSKLLQTKPSLEWWGVARKSVDSSFYNLIRARNCYVNERKPPPEAIQKSALDALRENVRASYSASNDRATQLWDRQIYNNSHCKADVGQTISRGFRPVLAPKTLKKEEWDDDPHPVRDAATRNLPKIYKQQLINYARGKQIFCEKIFI